MFTRETDGREQGQALVEFALILPLMLLMLFALVDFGRAFYSWLIVTNAAREGARVAATQVPLTDVEARIYDSATVLDAADLQIFTSNVQGPRGEPVVVDIEYSFNFVTPISSIAQLLGGSALSDPTITGHASMRLE